MKTILVVDDERDLLTAVSGVLADEGYEVLEACDGREALDVLRKRRPDLALVDMMMPFMSGAELVDAIRREPKLEGLPVVLMSAVESAGETDHVAAFLKKPFPLQRLLAVVGDLVGE